MQPIEVEGSKLYTSASIGVALYPDHGLNDSDLMNNADVAMYEAKSSGRNAIKVYGNQLVSNIFRDIS
jgi:diguanylate cyclase (GGDEF)-like protein